MASIPVLTGRPSEPPSAEDVHVDVQHALPGQRAVVDHETESLVESFAFGDLIRCLEEVDEPRRIALRVELVDARNVRARNDLHVRRRLWIDVSKRDDALVFVDDVRRDVSGNDLAEDAVAQNTLTLSSSRRAMKSV